MCDGRRVGPEVDNASQHPTVAGAGKHQDVNFVGVITFHSTVAAGCDFFVFGLILLSAQAVDRSLQRLTSARGGSVARSFICI